MIKNMDDSDKVVLFFQFNSAYYKSNILEKVVRDAASYAKQNIPNAKIEYIRVNIDPGETILSEILKHVDSASYCVFEISDNNPNVFLELGYALGRDKPIAILKNKKSTQPTPSDITGLYLLYYENENSLKNLSLDLSEHIEKNIRAFLNTRYNYLLRRIWSFDDNEEVIFVSGNLKGQYLVLPPDANALLEAVLTVKKVYPNLNLQRYYAIDLPRRYLEKKSIVSVGGPSSNQITRIILNSINFPWDNIRPSPDERQIMYNKLTKEKRERELDEEGHVIRDFGFFIKVPNPFNNKKTAILIVALTTEGVWGTAKVFSYNGKNTYDNCKMLFDKIGDNEYFGVITETVVDNGRFIDKPLCHEIYAYNPEKKEWIEV